MMTGIYHRLPLAPFAGLATTTPRLGPVFLATRAPPGSPLIPGSAQPATLTVIEQCSRLYRLRMSTRNA